MRILVRIALALAAAALAACAGPAPKYHWGTYEPALYQYYKTPSRIDDFAAELARTIKQADEAKRKVPPGLYAEYGHILQRQGKVAEARNYYEKERSAWPESTMLMDALLKSADAPAKQTQPAGKPQS